MNEGPRYVSFRDYVRVARERRWLIIGLTLLFGATALWYSHHHHRGYQAEADLRFQSLNEQASLFGLFQDTGGETPDQRAAPPPQRPAQKPNRISPREVPPRAVKLSHGKVTSEQLFEKVTARAE